MANQVMGRGQPLGLVRLARASSMYCQDSLLIALLCWSCT